MADTLAEGWEQAAVWDQELARANPQKLYDEQSRGLELTREYSNIPDGLRKHAIAFHYRKYCRWVVTPEIIEARRSYDEGRTEMCQGLFMVCGEEAWVLFSIPRRTPRKVKKGKELAYFSRREF